MVFVGVLCVCFDLHGVSVYESMSECEKCLV